MNKNFNNSDFMGLQLKVAAFLNLSRLKISWYLCCILLSICRKNVNLSCSGLEIGQK